jgi:hypothetical protein
MAKTSSQSCRECSSQFEIDASDGFGCNATGSKINTKVNEAVLTFISIAAVSIAATNYSLGQTREEIRSKFLDLHDDTVPHNCERATEWLYKRREKLKDDLLDEFYKTDWQGRASIFHILCHTASFTPDLRFIRSEAARLPNQYTDEDDWRFIDAHFKELEPFLKEQIRKTDEKEHDMFVLWAIAWLAKKRGVIDQYSPLYTPEILAKAAANLKNDDKDSNASQAVRLFLLLGDQSLPTLREAAKSSDVQARSLARATIDALAGKRSAFGYLVSKVYLPRTPFGEEVPEPDWVPAMVEPYLDREIYP